MEGDDDIAGEEFPNNMDNFVNKKLANYAAEVPDMMSIMHHQFRGYQFLSEGSP